LDRSQRYYPRLTREAIEIFKHENIINRKEEITLLDPEWKRTTLFLAEVIMASCEEDADYMLRKLQEEYEKWGMSMNMTKTEYMRVGEGDEDQDLELYLE